MMELKHVSHVYDKGLPFETRALNDISFVVDDGDFLGIAGRTGSGKSTLIRIMATLIAPTGGCVALESGKRVGISFQFPEHQLFEETVMKDVMFGPKNLGLSDASSKAVEALEMVGLDESFLDRSPFALSGGEQRRVAIAGVLAMDPDLLILDEPTAGLDRAGHDLVMSILRRLNHEGKAIVLVSHNMDDILENCREMVLLDCGCLADKGRPIEVLGRHREMAPERLALAFCLEQAGFSNVDCGMGVDALAAAVAAQLI